MLVKFVTCIALKFIKNASDTPVIFIISFIHICVNMKRNGM